MEETKNEKRYILIGGAWPYANSSLHLGHLAALLPGDVLARYYREKGDNVVVSKYAGTEVKYEGEDYIILREEDILATVE